MHLATIAGKEEVVDFLLSTAVDQMAKDREGRNAFHLAAMTGKEAVLDLLLDNGWNIEAKDRESMTALHLACKVGSLAMAKLLIERGANKKALSGEKMRPLAIAYENGHEGIVHLLHREEADKEWRNGASESLLHIASRGPKPALIQELLNDGYDVNSMGCMDASPLHCAAEYGRRLNGELLIAANANLEHRTWYGKTPLWHAVLNERTDFVKLLLEKGASVHVESIASYGNPSTTLLSTAMERNNKKIIDLLEQHMVRHPLAASNASATTETPQASLRAGSLSDTSSHEESAPFSGGPSPDVAG